MSEFFPYLVPKKVRRKLGRIEFLLLRMCVCVCVRESCSVSTSPQHPIWFPLCSSRMLWNQKFDHVLFSPPARIPCPLNSPRCGLCGSNQLRGLGQVPSLGICSPSGSVFHWGRCPHQAGTLLIFPESPSTCLSSFLAPGKAWSNPSSTLSLPWLSDRDDT